MAVGPRRRAGITLGVAGAIVAVALWWNAPSKKPVDFLAICQQLAIPAPIALNLNEGATQLANVTLYGFEGTVSHLSRQELTRADRRTVHTAPRFALVAPSEPPLSYLKVVPNGALGTVMLNVKPGVTLAASAAGLRVESRRSGDAELVIQSDGAAFEGARYAVEGFAPPGPALAEFSIVATGEPPGMLATLVATPVRGPANRADVTFADAGNEVVLLDGDRAVAFGPAGLRCAGAESPRLRIDGRRASGLIDDEPLDLVMDVETATIARLAIQPGAPGLRVGGSGVATSVRQDERELLPTWIQETLEASQWERSIRLVVLGLAAFTLFKLVDHAIGVLLKWVMGE